MPVVASHCQTLPAGAGHSHSIVNEHEKSFIFNAVLMGCCVDTMKNTMFRICCKLARKLPLERCHIVQ